MAPRICPNQPIVKAKLPKNPERMLFPYQVAETRTANNRGGIGRDFSARTRPRFFWDSEDARVFVKTSVHWGGAGYGTTECEDEYEATSQW
jgi:hypothetical protein